MLMRKFSGNATNLEGQATPLQRQPSPSDKSYVMDAVNSDGVVVIGKGTRIKGEITEVQRLEIQGAVEGKIIADVLIVRESGVVSGELKAQQAEIHGRFEGQLEVADHLDVRSTGRVEGQLSYGQLSVAMGGYIAGTVSSETPDPRLAESGINGQSGNVVSLTDELPRLNGFAKH